MPAAYSKVHVVTGKPLGFNRPDEALQQHFKTAHIAEFMQAIGPTLVAPADVKFHEIARTRDLATVSG